MEFTGGEICSELKKKLICMGKFDGNGHSISFM
jgi:hypothetical protein